MNNGNTNHDFDSISGRLDYQDIVLDVLLDHLAGLEATVLALMAQTLSNEDLRMAKRLRGRILSEISDKIVAEVKRNLEDS